MRAVAVLLVVLGHAGVPGVSGGFVGVDVFFVISGFLITSLLLRELAGTGRISLVRFYARRAVRLLPASTLVLVTTLAAAWLWLAPARFPEHAANALAAAAYSVNFRLAGTGTDYFADQAPSPFQHFWSLAVEEQFYLLWPLLIIAVTSIVARRRPLAVVLAVLVLASFVASVVVTDRAAPWAYFGPHTRAWELGAGALVALAAGRLSGLDARVAAVLGPAGLAAILLAAVLFDDATPFPGAAALLPVAGAAAVVAAGATRPLRPLGARPAQLIGRLSYGWYLWHWPLLVLVAADGVAVRLALCAAALVLAWVTYHLVENPVRHRRELTARPWRGAGLGLLLSAAAAAAALVAAMVPPAVTRGAPAVDTAAALAGAADPAAELTRLIAAAQTPAPFPANLSRSPAEAAQDRARPQTDGCHLSFEPVEPAGPCTYGRPDAPATVVLFGDSHALQWFPALEALAARRDWRLVPLTKSSCSPAVLELRLTRMKRDYPECTRWRIAALERIRALAPDLVVVGSSTAYRTALAGDPADPDAAWRGGWAQAMTALTAAARHVSVLADTPFLPAEPADCSDGCAFPAAAVVKNPQFRQIVVEQARRAGAGVVDPTPWLCAARCPVVVGNLLVYRDSNHLSTGYATLLAGLLEARLPRLY